MRPVILDAYSYGDSAGLTPDFPFNSFKGRPKSPAKINAGDGKSKKKTGDQLIP
jgi:hypothetical protein